MSGFFGIGGGIILVPVLILGIGMQRRRASGTSLGIIVFVAGTGVAVDVVESAESRPAILAALLIIPGAILCSRLAARFASRVPARVLRRLFGLVLLLAAVRLMDMLPARLSTLRYADFSALNILLLPVLGCVVGSVSALAGIGGGVILVPALAMTFADLDIIQCRATSLLIVAPIAFSGFVEHQRQGTADLGWVRRLAPACVAGAAIGALVVHRVPPGHIRQVFGVFLALVGLWVVLVEDPKTRP